MIKPVETPQGDLNMIFLDSSYIKGLILKGDDYNRQSKKIKALVEHNAAVINLNVLVEILGCLHEKLFIE